MRIALGGWHSSPLLRPANKLLYATRFLACEKSLIREYWVLIDLLGEYRQLGVDVMVRMREFNKERRLF